DLVERGGVRGTGQRRGRSRTKLVRTLECKRGDEGPVREDRRRERRRRWLVVARRSPGRKRERLHCRPVVAAEGEDPLRNCLADADSLVLVQAIRYLR